MSAEFVEYTTPESRKSRFDIYAGFTQFAQRVQEKFARKETGPYPPIAVDFMFAPHSTAEHAAGLEVRILEADIYIPELMGWDNKSLKLLQQVADGKIDYY